MHILFEKFPQTGNKDRGCNCYYAKTIQKFLKHNYFSYYFNKIRKNSYFETYVNKIISSDLIIGEIKSFINLKIFTDLWYKKTMLMNDDTSREVIRAQKKRVWHFYR